MILNNPVLQRYPYCKHYIEEFLSNKAKFAAKYPRVFQAFLRACTIELDRDQLKRVRPRIEEVFTLGRGPVVSPENLLTKRCGLFHPGSGQKQWSDAQFIRVNLDVCDAYEHGTGWVVFEGVLLHECVHWARFHSGNYDEDGGDWNTSTFERLANFQEIGHWFNVWAYGYDVCDRDEDGKIKQLGPPGTLPKDDQDDSRVPAWAQGWWTVYDGNYYYYYFYPDGRVVYIKTKPDSTWLPPNTVANEGVVTLVPHGLSIIWREKGRGVLTKEDFTRVGWTSTTEMNGRSNKYAPLYARKM
jgi:Metallopeptidase toxin 3